MGTSSTPTARQPAGAEVWLVTLGRVLAAFGLGVLAAAYYPGVAGRLGLPAALAGIVCLVVAAGLRRRPQPPIAREP